jgi:hypothetical protein
VVSKLAHQSKPANRPAIACASTSQKSNSVSEPGCGSLTL